MTIAVKRLIVYVAAALCNKISERMCERWVPYKERKEARMKSLCPLCQQRRKEEELRWCGNSDWKHCSSCFHSCIDCACNYSGHPLKRYVEVL